MVHLKVLHNQHARHWSEPHRSEENDYIQMLMFTLQWTYTLWCNEYCMRECVSPCSPRRPNICAASSPRALTGCHKGSYTQETDSLSLGRGDEVPHGGRFMEQYWHLPGRRLAASLPRTLRQVIRVYQNRGGLKKKWGGWGRARWRKLKMVPHS